MFKAFIDEKLGRDGKVVVTDDKTDKEVLVFKGPFLLRVRCWLAKRRIVVRARKLAKFNKRNAK
jgi:hypothetical protein